MEFGLYTGCCEKSCLIVYGHYSRLAISGIALSLLLVGCVVAPDPIEPSAHVERSKQDLATIRSTEFVPTKPIQLHEAMARAVAFNLRHRIAEIEREIAEAELEKNNFELLPSLDVSAGRDRNNVKVSNSDDRITSTASATFAWNLLDLGVSYARAKQQADEVLIAQEQERKALQDIIRQVNTAYWRAAAGQQLLVKVHNIARDLQTAMKASREMERSRATDTISAVTFRRTIVESVKQSLAIRRELLEAKAELGELLNIRPGTPFELATPATKVSMPRLPMSVENLEVFALENRPELRIEKYNERISDWQAREALYNMLPGLKVSAGQNYSSDSTNLTPNWISAGVNMSMNLFQLFSGSSDIEIAEDKAELARRQRLALSMAVLTQVHMSRIKFQSATQQMRLAHEIAESDRKLTQLVRTNGQFLNNDYFEAVRLATQQLQSEMDEQRSYVDLVSAQADLMHAIGLDLLPDGMPVNNIAALGDTIRAMMMQWTVSDATPAEQSAGLPLDQLVSSMLSAESRDNFRASAEVPRRQANDGPQLADTLFTTGTEDPTDFAMSQQELDKTIPQTKPIEEQPNPGTANAVTDPGSDSRPPTLVETQYDPETEEDFPQPTIDWLNKIAPASQGNLADTEPQAGSRDTLVQSEISPLLPAINEQHMIHLGAFRRQANAVRLFNRLTTKPIAALADTELEISYTQDKQERYFFFVHTGTFKDRSVATDLCVSLKKISLNCLVTADVDLGIAF